MNPETIVQEIKEDKNKLFLSINGLHDYVWIRYVEKGGKDEIEIVCVTLSKDKRTKQNKWNYGITNAVSLPKEQYQLIANWIKK